MIGMKSRMIYLIIFFCFNSVIGSITNEDEIIENIKKTVEKLFSLWLLPCSEWIEIFTVDAIWYHPKFPNGIYSNQFEDFCQLNQKVRPALFRQDGEIRLTISGNQTFSPIYHLMVPYLYGQIQDFNRNSLFINSGYEYIQIFVDQQGNYRIKEIVEFFNRASIPFEWPSSN